MAEAALNCLWIGLFVGAAISGLRAIDSAWKAGYAKGRADEAELMPMDARLYRGTEEDKKINRHYEELRKARAP